MEQIREVVPAGSSVPRLEPGLSDGRMSAVAVISALLVAGAVSLASGLISLSGAGTGSHTRAVSTAATASPAAKAKAKRAYGKLPLRFEANRGQTDSQVKFIARGAGYTLFLTPLESVLSLRKPAHDPSPGAGPQSTRPAPGPASFATLRMRLAGANAHPQIDGLEPVAGDTNYLIGRDPHAWHTGVPSYASALSRGVYPGVDLLYHGRQGKLEYDFQVAPGADPNRIALAFSGARGVSLDRRGDLVLDTPAGVVRQHKPVIYQEIAGRRHAVSGRFAVHGHRVGFRVGAYDRTQTLVIDPTLAYSTYLGGGAIDLGAAIAVDSSGSAYVTGFTSSADFPTRNAFQGSSGGGQDVFVSKLTPDGAALAYSTFLGGSANDVALGIAVDGSNAAYVTGRTSSTNFPVINALQSTCAGTSCADAFVAKVKPDGSGLVYSTYLGGDKGDIGNAIAVDSAGAAYLTGVTASSGSGTSTTSFPLKNAAQPTFGGGADAFMTKLDPNDGTSAVTLAYSTFLGGTGVDQAFGIALDPSGAAYLTGQTTSANFPTTANAYDRTCGTDTPATCNANKADAFVTKYTPAGAVAYSTFLGGSAVDQGFGIAVGRGASDAGTAYVVGQTTSTDLPTTPGARQTTFGGFTDAFVTKLNAAGSALVYSTYLGGQSFESKDPLARPGIAVNSAGNAFVDGQTQSNDFPIVRPVAEAGSSFYVAEFNSAGSDLVFSTFFGGGTPGAPSGMALDSAGNAYITGATSASDFPTLNPFQAKRSTPADAFVAKFSPASDTNPAAPYVLGVSPRGGDVSRGRQVKITGTGFGAASAVAFGGVAAASFTVDSATQITAVSPAHSTGSVAVTVTTGLGTSPPNPISRFVYGEGMFANTGPVPFAFGADPFFDRAPTVTLLKTGKVLVAGAGTASAALYDPKAGAFAATGSMSVSRQASIAALLPSGKVLIVGGGENPAVGELYDPAAGTFSPTRGAPLFSPTQGSGTATLLKSGKVLITGTPASGTFGAQLYDPATDTFSATSGQPTNDHSSGQAALLPNGKVLLAGGPGPNFDTIRSAELYDPSSDAFTATGALNTGRIRFTLTPLPSGKVLAVGGTTAVGILTASAELYDPQTGVWTVTGSLDDVRSDHAATLLPSGKVLITGGTRTGVGISTAVAEAKLFDPAAGGGQGGFVSAGRLEDGMAAPGATLLSSDTSGFAADPAVCGDNCGKVLVTGFGRIITASTITGASVAELYTPGAVVSSGPPGGGTGPGTGTGSTGGLIPGVTPGVTPGGGTPNTQAPVVSGFGLTNNPFVVGRGKTPTFGSAAKARAKKHRKGTTFRYTLSEAATVRIVIAQRGSGRRRGKSCVAPTRKLRRARRCTRIITQGTLTRISHQGADRVAFSGRIGSRALRPGRYQATLVAVDAARHASKPRTISFTIVKS